MGLAPTEARAAVRWSLGHGTTESDIDRALEVLPSVVERVRRGRGDSWVDASELERWT
jgi:cysteine desulfurase